MTIEAQYKRDHCLIPLDDFHNPQILQNTIKILWTILEDIDSVCRSTKDATELYLKVDELQQMRWLMTPIYCDGYDLFIPVFENKAKVDWHEPINSEIPLDEHFGTVKLIKTIKTLWDIIDSIDTLSDATRGDYEEYKRVVSKIYIKVIASTSIRHYGSLDEITIISSK